MNIEDIRLALDKKIPIEYSVHCQKRMIERGISRSDIKNCIYTGEIIEDYPLSPTNTSAESFPSCLVMGFKNASKDYIHVVVGFNSLKIIIISAYYPDDAHWENDKKTRRN